MRSSSSREQTSSTCTVGAPIFLTSSVKTPGSDSIVHHQLNINYIQIFMQSSHQSDKFQNHNFTEKQQTNKIAAMIILQKEQDQQQFLLQTTMAYYQQNRLSIKTCTHLANLLAEILLLNESIQSFKEALANTPYFDSLGLFRMLDKEQKGYLCEKDIQRVIGTTHRKLLTYAFSWMDNLKVGQISRLQFAAFMLPKDNLELREIVAKRIEHPQLSFSQNQTMLQQFDIFREMILEIMKKEMRLIELRRTLIDSKDYSLRGVAMAIDSSRHQWVCTEDLFKFMKNYGFDANFRQIQKLVEVINFNAEGKVTEDQLKWTVEGLEGKDKSYLKKIKHSNKQPIPIKPINFEQNFQKHLSIKQKNHQTSTGNNLIQGVYRQLVEKKKLIQQQQNLIDKNLLAKREIVLENTKNQFERERINLKVRKEIQARKKQEERKEWLAQKQMERVMEQFISRTAALEQQSQRLIRLQNKLTIQEDIERIRKTTLGIEPKYPYLQNKQNYVPYLYQPQDYHSYSIDLPLRSWTQKENNPIKRHIQNSDAYLEASRQLREKIKRERDIEKNIHQQFLSTPDSKYGSFFESHKSRKHPIAIPERKIPGYIKDASRNQISTVQHELGLASNKKNSSRKGKDQFSLQINSIGSGPQQGSSTINAEQMSAPSKLDYSTALKDNDHS